MHPTSNKQQQNILFRTTDFGRWKRFSSCLIFRLYILIFIVEDLDSWQQNEVLVNWKVEDLESGVEYCEWAIGNCILLYYYYYY